MQDYHGYFVSITGVLLMFGILQGVCVSADTVYRATGSSLDLTLTYPKEKVSTVQWIFKEKQFAEYSQSNAYSYRESQFTGRLKEDNDKVGLTVQNLQLQDSGTFKVVVDGTERQYPTLIFTVYVQSPITAVQIEKNQTWRESTNSCDVDVKCSADRAESVSYLWSGYKNSSGAQLQFSLSPAEGAITLNCTADNNVSSSSVTETLSCSEKKKELESDGIPQFVLIIVGVSASLLLIAVIAALCYLCRSHKDGKVADNGSTVYADVNPKATVKDRRSDSVINGMTVYETVDDLRMNPEMTIYAKVTLPQHAKVSTTSSSPYQQVC